MTNALFTCIICNDIFRSRYDLNNHVKRDHQSSVKVKLQNGGVTEVKKREDGTFKCKCGKSFKLPGSLQRHAKGCNGESAEPEQDEREVGSMEVDDSDASESMDVDDRVVRVDCFGALISREKC
jgi:uncharacterized C2H2 Zn-finger protein